MGICFVIQPFDEGEFDARYDQILAPAIKNAGLTPYRVDRDPSAMVIIDKIEEQIEKSVLCLADISLPNPNVWHEIGYARGKNKDVVLVCSHDVTTFPFDVSHIKIIRYKKGAPSDFEQYQNKITESIQALLKNEKTIEKITSSPIRETGGLSQHEMVVLVSIMQNRNSSEDTVSTHIIHNDMERAGNNRLAANLALTTLQRKQMIHSTREVDNFNEYFAYSLTEKGEDWLINNISKLNLNYEPHTDTSGSKEEIPF